MQLDVATRAAAIVITSSESSSLLVAISSTFATNNPAYTPPAAASTTTTTTAIPELSSSSSSSSFTPAATPPPGFIPNFEHPRDVLHSANWINTGVCLAVVVFFCAIRLYVRLTIKTGRILAEDCCFVTAWALTVLLGITYLFMAYHGEGYHVWELSQQDYKDFLKWLYISSVAYIPAAFATKATLLLLIARVFSVKEWISKVLRRFIICLAIAYLPIQIAKILVCRPISAYWEITASIGINGRNPYCVNQSHLFLSDISLAMITDFIILVVPIPLAMSMRALGFWQKCKIIVLLSAGGVATGITVFRTYRIVQFMSSTDPTADFTILSMFTILEVTIGIICACLPSFNVLLRSLTKNEGSSPNVPRTASSTRFGWRPYSLTIGTGFFSKLSRRSATAALTTVDRADGWEMERQGGDREGTIRRISSPPIDFEQELAIFSRGGFDATALDHSAVQSYEEQGDRVAPVEDEDEEERESLPEPELSLRVVTSWKGRIWDGRLAISESGSPSSPGPTPTSLGPTSSFPEAIFRSNSKEWEP